MKCVKNGKCKYQCDNGWNGNECSIKKCDCNYQDKTEDIKQFEYEHSDILRLNEE